MPDQKIPLLLTRPDGSNGPFADQLPPRIRARVAVTESPLMRITPLPDPDVPEPVGEAIFTSSNGVRFGPAGQGRRAWCVGERTTAAAAASGWSAVLAGETAEVLVRRLISEAPSARLVHMSGTHTRGSVAERLRDAGLEATRVPVYDQELLPLTSAARALFGAGNRVIVPLFSPRLAGQFVRECPRAGDVVAVCLSEAVASEVRDAGFAECIVSRAPNAAALIFSVEKLFD